MLMFFLWDSVTATNDRLDERQPTQMNYYADDVEVYVLTEGFDVTWKERE